MERVRQHLLLTRSAAGWSMVQKFYPTLLSDAGHALATGPFAKAFKEYDFFVSSTRLLQRELISIPVASLPTQYAYDPQVYARGLDMIDAIDRLALIDLMAQTAPPTDYLRSIGQSEIQWVHGRFVDHVMWAVTLFDVSLRLVNAVAHLGLSPKHCRYDVIIANAFIRDSAVGASLKPLKTALDEYRPLRNMIAHQAGVFSSDSLFALNIASAAKKHGYAVTRDDGVSLDQEIMGHLRAWISKRPAVLVDPIVTLLDGCLEAYEQISIFGNKYPHPGEADEVRARASQA